jgi:hypothetical protein
MHDGCITVKIDLNVYIQLRVYKRSGYNHFKTANHF